MLKTEPCPQPAPLARFGGSSLCRYCPARNVTVARRRRRSIAFTAERSLRSVRIATAPAPVRNAGPASRRRKVAPSAWAAVIAPPASAVSGGGSETNRERLEQTAHVPSRNLYHDGTRRIRLQLESWAPSSILTEVTERRRRRRLHERCWRGCR